MNKLQILYLLRLHEIAPVNVSERNIQLFFLRLQILEGVYKKTNKFSQNFQIMKIYKVLLLH